MSWAPTRPCARGAGGEGTAAGAARVRGRASRRTARRRPGVREDRDRCHHRRGRPRGSLTAADGTEYPVHGEVRLGRLPDNDISIDDTKVSREHAVITGSVSGFAVRDLQSSNGTYVGERRVSGQLPLSDGDELTLGRTTFRFRMVEE
ncbi:FHA domain-containing protein [Tsukamurella sp. PLM1]|uniref:FHA domain-containing protein n=1 Tax=Tsukamurella sp. PLM1 TaxID=2929795 RepID=UPI0020BEEFA4|nr:FHA domain-containing protein [Tsukamurella sp. PLM1]